MTRKNQKTTEEQVGAQDPDAASVDMMMEQMFLAAKTARNGVAHAEDDVGTTGVRERTGATKEGDQKRVRIAYERQRLAEEHGIPRYDR